MTAIAFRAVSSITTNDFERLMAQVHDPEHQAVVSVLSYRISEAERQIERVGEKVDALGEKIDLAQAERTAALTHKPWYSEPAFHMALLAAVLLLIIGARELGTENTGKLIDRFPSAPPQ